MDEPLVSPVKYGQQQQQLHWSPDYSLKALTDLIYLKIRSASINQSTRLPFRLFHQKILQFNSFFLYIFNTLLESEVIVITQTVDADFQMRHVLIVDTFDPDFQTRHVQSGVQGQPLARRRPGHD